MTESKSLLPEKRAGKGPKNWIRKSHVRASEDDDHVPYLSRLAYPQVQMSKLIKVCRTSSLFIYGQVFLNKDAKKKNVRIVGQCIGTFRRSQSFLQICGRHRSVKYKNRLRNKDELIEIKWHNGKKFHSGIKSDIKGWVENKLTRSNERDSKVTE